MGFRVTHNTTMFQKLRLEYLLLSYSLCLADMDKLTVMLILTDEFQGMISRMDGIQCCSADEFIQTDDQLPVCQHFDEEGWDASFIDDASFPD